MIDSVASAINRSSLQLFSTASASNLAFCSKASVSSFILFCSATASNLAFNSNASFSSFILFSSATAFFLKPQFQDLSILFCLRLVLALVQNAHLLHPSTKVFAIEF